jgi:glycosyltransferase involved in cell wall biosynthesis
MGLIMIHAPAPWSGSGYGQQCALWSQKLREMGHEVVISAFWGLAGTPIQWNGITVLPGFGGQYCSPSLQQHAKHVNPDLVITLGDVWVLDPNVLRELPVAHWLPGDCRPMSTADRNVLEASGSQLIAMSRFGEARFKAAGFSPFYVPHGISLDVFKPVEDQAARRARRGMDPDAFVVGVNAANNDAIRKAAPEMMMAFAKFHQSHPDAILALHTGVHQDGGQDLEAVAENLGITDRVMVVDQYRYTSGLITPQDMNDWYNCVGGGGNGVLLASTYGEGFGLPIVEAMACGVPVITTRCSSMEELNPDGIQVEGSPFFNGVHKAWWIRPSPGEIWRALEQAYEQRDGADPVKLRESVAEYEAGVVAEKHMAPVVNTLLEHFAARKAAAA